MGSDEKNTDEKKLNSTEEGAAGEGVEVADSIVDSGVDFEAQAKENHENYLRALADFDNYKKRSIKERSELIKYGSEVIATDLLEVVDNFERALTSSSGEKSPLRDGVEMIYKQLTELLSKHGVRGESSLGKPFDPQIHQAISQAPAADYPSGTVCSELKKAYFLKDKLIRVGQVVVASSESGNSSESKE